MIGYQLSHPDGVDMKTCPDLFYQYLSNYQGLEDKVIYDSQFGLVLS